MTKYGYRITKDGKTLQHSKGNWTNHKYQQKIGTGPKAKYIYSKQSSGSDPSSMNALELAKHVKQSAQRENEAYNDMQSKYQAMLDSGYKPGKTFVLGEQVDSSNAIYKVSYGKDTQKAVAEYNDSVTEFKSARDEAFAARKEVKNRAKK